MPGGTVHDGTTEAETSIAGPLRTTVPQPDTRTAVPPPDSRTTVPHHDSRDVAPQPAGSHLDTPEEPPAAGPAAPPVHEPGMPPVLIAGQVPGTDPAGAPPAGDGIDPGERTPRSFHLSRSLLERARAAAYWLAQLPDRSEPTNVSELVERALAYEVRRLEQAYNNGTPFPAVVGRMRTGPGASGVERIRRAQRARRRQEPGAGTTDPDPGDAPASVTR